MPAYATLSAEGVVPEKALAYWKSKKPVSSAAFKALGDAAKSRSFAVAGLAKLDMVSDLHASLHEAMRNGETLASWQKRIPQVIEESGWTGRRIETIYRTNVQTAYMAGRYAEMMETAQSRPYWQYVAIGDARTRPAHAVLNGMVFRYDDAFWDTNYPPNGFRCRCTVRTLSARQMDKMGVEVQKGPPGVLVYTDPATGMERHIASVLPDSGFATNPGKSWLNGLAPTEIDAAQTRDLVRAAVCKASGNFASGDACRPPLASLPAKHILPIKPGDILPRGLTEAAYALAFLKEFGLKSLNESALHTLPGVKLPLVIDKGLFMDKATRQLKADKNGRGPFLRLLARTIQKPYEIWQVPTEISGKKVTCLRLIRLFAAQGKTIGGFGVFSLYGNQWQGSTLFNPKGENTRLMLQYLENQRQGTLVFREEP